MRGAQTGLDRPLPSFFRQGMGFVHHPLEMVAGDMGVDFRGGDIGMAQKGLDTAKVRAPFHQMGSKGVTQHMRRNLGGI